MGSLTANLRLMMVSLYRPEAHKTHDPDGGPGPSDRYAADSRV